MRVIPLLRLLSGCPLPDGLLGTFEYKSVQNNFSMKTAIRSRKLVLIYQLQLVQNVKEVQEYLASAFDDENVAIAEAHSTSATTALLVCLSLRKSLNISKWAQLLSFEMTQPCIIEYDKMHFSQLIRGCTHHYPSEPKSSKVTRLLTNDLNLLEYVRN